MALRRIPTPWWFLDFSDGTKAGVVASLEPALIAMMEAEDPKAAWQVVRTELAGVEARLTGDYAAGDSLTAADVLLHGELWWMSAALEPIPKQLPRLTAYYERHQERFGWTGE